MRPRGTRGYWAFVGHRLSGVALAAFLPLHLLLLSQALHGADRLQAWLNWSEHGWVRLAEWGLVSCLCLHLVFGLRILVIEVGPPRSPANMRLGWIVPGLVLAVAVGGVFYWLGGADAP
ncbi:MAG: succinate dehydrogenase, cytochrome b556 subunit [Burkholderiaceae bacterium]